MFDHHLCYQALNLSDLIMVGGPNAFARIEQDWQDFCIKAEQCLSASAFNAADYRDAIGRMSQLRERFLRERSTLPKPQAQALAKAFVDDHFIKGLMNGPRQISAHVQKRQTEPTIRVFQPDNSPLDLDCETSAAGFFTASGVFVVEDGGNQQRIDHLKNLAEAKKRIERAMDNARPS